MISIKNLNKYFFKNKKNEIHVINNTSLEFSSTGLIALLGPSGCGKTTLLNAIGGLDKVNSGEIYINGKRLTRTLSSKKDEIRNLNIGYIFQDYHLLNDMSVFDNVALVLKMIGIKDKEEIKRRVNYVLETVGIYKYRKRLACMLSGGERQRVGIARAIVKNPNIIIADEPTGNLDSKNTIEVMNIIKSISKDKLVILVTHEKELAYFYASRIIELKDGKVISDKENIHDNSLNYHMENKIYLKDIKKHDELLGSNLNVNYYSESDESLDINIVLKNGNIYIEANTKHKIEIIDENSSIELINDTYKEITKESYEKYNFNYKEILNDNIKLKYSSIYNLSTLLKEGFKKIKSYSVLKKILLVGFFISSMFILYSVSNIAGILNIKDEKFVTHNKNYLSIIDNKIDKDEYLKYENLDNINYILPGDSDVTFNVKYNFYYQTNYASDTLKGSLSSINMISKDDLIYGRMPNNEYEIVVDKLSITNMFKYSRAKQVGIINVEDVLGLTAYIDNISPFKIVGITDLESPSIYTDESLFINILSNTVNRNNDIFGYYMEDIDTNRMLDYSILGDKIKLKSGKLPINDYEVIVNYNNRYEYALNKEINIKVNDTKLKVVGYYESSEYTNMLSNLNTIKYKLLDTSKNITVYPKDKVEALDYFSNNLNIMDIYEKDKEEYISKHKNSIISSTVVAGIILIISLVEIYLMIRSSFLSRIKEIGILRAIGVKKIDIYKMFLGEILAITFTASLGGILFMSYILNGITKLPLVSENYLFNPIILIASLIFVVLSNIIIGLLPVFNTIRKTPAQILSRTDID